MKLDLDAIETAAREATPGPWSRDHRETALGSWNTEVFCAKGKSIATLRWYPKPIAPGITGTYRADNATHIANMDPATVLLMCKAIRAAKTTLEYHARLAAICRCELSPQETELREALAPFDAQPEIAP